MRTRLALFSLVALAACSDVGDPNEANEEEVITTVELTFTGGDETFTAVWSDIENDGSALVDDIGLLADTTYTVDVRFLNELEDPAEDITEEVEDESDQHQVFFTGTAVDDGLLTATYDDTDANGLPVGLSWTLDTGAAGTGDLVVTLQHLPPVDDAAQKEDGLADQAATNGVSSLPGDADVNVSFAVTVE